MDGPPRGCVCVGFVRPEQPPPINHDVFRNLEGNITSILVTKRCVTVLKCHRSSQVKGKVDDGGKNAPQPARRLRN